MTNNDILRRIRYVFDFDDANMINLFGLGNCNTERIQINNWLRKDEDPEMEILSDHQLISFLNGLIIAKRGPKDDGKPIETEVLTNNIIFRKLKIALNLRDDEILAIMEKASFPISKHELSAFFRHPSQNQYRTCNHQILRNFIYGLQLSYRQE